MKLHTSAMALIDHEAQRIPWLSRSDPLCPREVTTPGLQGTLVESIPFSTYLEKDRITSHTLKQGQTIAQQLACFITR